MKTLSYYQCEICGNIYEDELTALSCEQRGSSSFKITIGDLIEINPRYEPAQKVEVTEVYTKGHVTIVKTEEKFQMSKDDYLGTNEFIASDEESVQELIFDMKKIL